MAGSTTKQTTKKTVKSEAAPAVEAEPAVEAAVEDNSVALTAELQAAQAEIASLQGQVNALSPEPEPEPEPLTMEQRVENCERAVDAIVASLKECFAPHGQPSKLRARLRDRGV
jgi:hypothetical protein